MSRRCTSLAGDPSPGHRSIKILRFRGPPILGPCKNGVLRPVRHAQRIAPIHAKRHILADRWHLGIIRAKPLESIIILGAPVCKALQRPVLALISLIDHVITPLLAQSSAATRGLLLRPVVPKHSNITSLLCISGVNGSAAATAAHTPAATGCVFVLFANNIRTAAKWARQQLQISNAFKILCFHFFIRSFVLFSCPLSWGWRVQSVLWGGVPAPVGLMPAPRRAGGHCWRWVRVVSPCRACDRVYYP